MVYIEGIYRMQRFYIYLFVRLVHCFGFYPDGNESPLKPGVTEQ